MKTTIGALALVLMCAGAAGTARADEAVTPPPTAVSHAMATRAVVTDRLAAYAQRERKAAPELASFQGGDVVVISATTLVAVLLVVLIVAVVL